MTNITWVQVEPAITTLREDYRIKINTDYAITLKYNTVYLLCQEIYADSINEVFANNGLLVENTFTY